MIYDIAIVGGGAAGLYAASLITEVKGRPFKGLIIDKGKDAGTKLLMSGGGMCNFTHDGSIKDFVGHYGDRGNKIRSLLYAHSNTAVITHFGELGVEAAVREDGKIFPASLSAKDVRDALLKKGESNGFEIMRETSASHIEIISLDAVDTTLDSQNSNSLFSITINTKHGKAEKILCKYLIIAAGGRSYPATGSDGSIFPVLNAVGIESTPLFPALVPVYVEGYPYSHLSGISFPQIELIINSSKKFTGDLLFTHSCLSGPLILNASRYIKTGDKISLSYLPGKTLSEASAALKKMAAGFSKTPESLISFFAGENGRTLPKRFCETLIFRGLQRFYDETGYPLKGSSLSGAALDSLALLLVKDEFYVSGLGSFNNAMVTRGGVSLSEINLKTMETKKYPRLFIIGECLDVDGDTGGYNLQFAFSCAAAAAKAISLP